MVLPDLPVCKDQQVQQEQPAHLVLQELLGLPEQMVQLDLLDHKVQQVLPDFKVSQESRELPDLV